MEAELLGLTAVPKKKEPSKQARAKRTMDQIVAEEVSKLHTEYDGLTEALEKWPDTPTGQAIGALDRKLSRQIKKLKDQHQYEAHAQLEKLSQSLEMLRICSKAGAKNMFCMDCQCQRTCLSVGLVCWGYVSRICSCNVLFAESRQCARVKTGRSAFPTCSGGGRLPLRVCSSKVGCC